MTALAAPRPQDKVVILKRVPVFAACSVEQLHFIADRTRLLEYKKGEYIFHEGDKAEAFYIVSSGRLRIFSQVDGQEKTLATLHNSDFFGEMALLIGEVRSATAQALNDTLALVLEKRHFDAVINRIPALVLYPATKRSVAPVARDDAFSLVNGELAITADIGVLVNDRDDNHDRMRVKLVSDVSHGTLKLKPDGSFSYVSDGSLKDGSGDARHLC